MWAMFECVHAGPFEPSLQLTSGNLSKSLAFHDILYFHRESSFCKHGQSFSCSPDSLVGSASVSRSSLVAGFHISQQKCRAGASKRFHLLPPWEWTHGNPHPYGSGYGQKIWSIESDVLPGNCQCQLIFHEPYPELGPDCSPSHNVELHSEKQCMQL